MNRWWIAVVLGLTVTGCAEGVDDPLPPPPARPAREAPPARTMAGELPNTADELEGDEETTNLDAPWMQQAEPPRPGPLPEPGGG
ncbi:MAG TPA: hypothetical protein VM925_16475 [Labilithrix sp.]|nr:hypothetical protein [Labilithrix sp.]